MNFEQMIRNITPDIHTRLRRAIELGKWPDGKLLSPQQRELCMEAVISYEHRFLAEEQRVGYIDRGSKAEGEQCEDKTDPAHVSPIKWS